MKKKEIDHTTIRNGKLFCNNCGGEHKLNMPISIPAMTKKISAFNELHGSCEKTWTQPEASQDKSVSEKAMFWMDNGQIGLSSKTMWNCLMGNQSFSINHPYDPDDFSRCYKLLRQVPEWKSELHKLKPLSRQWASLIDNWDKLTEMYELNVKNDWKTYKDIGMGEFMYTLIK